MVFCHHNQPDQDLQRRVPIFLAKTQCFPGKTCISILVPSRSPGVHDLSPTCTSSGSLKPRSTNPQQLNFSEKDPACLHRLTDTTRWQEIAMTLVFFASLKSLFSKNFRGTQLLQKPQHQLDSERILEGTLLDHVKSDPDKRYSKHFEKFERAVDKIWYTLHQPLTNPWKTKKVLSVSISKYEVCLL